MKLKKIIIFLYLKEHFKSALLEEAEKSRHQARDLLNDFLSHGPFSSDWSAEEGLKYLAEMQERLQAMKERDENLRNDLGIFGLSFPESLDLSRLEGVGP